MRYDGARFSIFNRNNTPGINDNRCAQLLETRDGTLWILTDLGLISYRDRKFRSLTGQDGLPAKISKEFESPDGGLILAGRDGLFSWQNGRSIPLLTEGVHPGDGDLIYQDRAGAIWFGLHFGAFYKFSNGKLVNYPTLSILPQQQQNDRVIAALEDRQGRLWFGTTSAWRG